MERARQESFLTWLYATCNWQISSGNWKGRRYTVDAFPCQADLLADNSHQQAVMKSAQMAISEIYTLARPFYAADVLGVNWGIMFPGQGAMRNFFRTRLKAVIALNQHLRLNTTAVNETNVDAFGRTIYLRYTSTETAIATFDADGVTIDEQDLHNANSLYGAKTSRRQGAMEETYWHEVSTPTFPKAGIHQSFLNSDQKVWLIKCAACGFDNDLTRKVGPYKLEDVEEFFRDFLTDARFPRWQDYHIPCSSCGKPIDPVTPATDGGTGRWVARYPGREISGYHLQIFQRLYQGGTPRVLDRVRGSLLDAKQPEHVRRWWNFTIGVPYSSGVGRLSDDHLDGASTDDYDRLWINHPVFRHIWGLEKQHCDWLGVDVRGEQYHCWGLTRTSGDNYLVTAAGWVNDITDLRLLWDMLGRPSFLIDAEPDVNESRKFVASLHRRAWRVFFGSGYTSLWNETGSDHTLSVNRPAIMESTQAMISGRAWQVPRKIWDVGAGIFKQQGDHKEEERVRDHFTAPRMVKATAMSSRPDSYDFPTDAMEGIDPHFFMAACLANLGTMIQAAPAQAIVIPR
jgi:hypothetical protein